MKRIAIISFVVLAFMVSLFIPHTTALASEKGEGCPNKMRKGDTFVYKVGKVKHEIRVTEVNDNGSFYIKRKNLNTNKRKNKFIDCSDGMLPFFIRRSLVVKLPLSVGMKYRSSYTDKKKDSMQNINYRVGEVEKVSTEAGEFDAYSIEFTTTLKKGAGINKEAKGTLWYAPQAGVIVKAKLSWTLGYELVSIKRARNKNKR